jgi:hypothetical protein
VVNVSPEARTIAPPPGASRTCASCKKLRPLADFELIDPGKGTIDRRRICTPCITRVDEMLRAGERNVSAISRQTGVSHGTIRERRDELGLGGRAYRRLDDIDALTELTLANMEPDVIADHLNVEVHTVRRYQRKLGLREAASRRALTSEELERADWMLRVDRASYPETARTLGVDPSVLRLRFPGFEWTRADRSTMTSILQTPELRRMHHEIIGTIAID